MEVSLHFLCVCVFFCPPTLVEGDYSNGFVHPSVDTILSLQLLLQFSRDFDETFQLLFP